MSALPSESKSAATSARVEVGQLPSLALESDALKLPAPSFMAIQPDAPSPLATTSISPSRSKSFSSAALRLVSGKAANSVVSSNCSARLVISRPSSSEDSCPSVLRRVRVTAPAIMGGMVTRASWLEITSAAVACSPIQTSAPWLSPRPRSVTRPPRADSSAGCTVVSARASTPTASPTSPTQAQHSRATAIATIKVLSTRRATTIYRAKNIPLPAQAPVARLRAFATHCHVALHEPLHDRTVNQPEPARG